MGVGWADHAYIHGEMRGGSEGYHLAWLHKYFNHSLYKYFQRTSFVLGLMLCSRNMEMKRQFECYLAPDWMGETDKNQTLTIHKLNSYDFERRLSQFTSLNFFSQKDTFGSRFQIKMEFKYRQSWRGSPNWTGKKKNHKQSLGIGNEYFLIEGNLVHFRGWGLFGRNGVKSAIYLYYF